MSDEEAPRHKITDEDFYMLIDRVAVKARNFEEWTQWRLAHRAERYVKQENFAGYWISTVFIGVDMNIARIFRPELPPLLFETIAFSPDQQIVAQERTSTYGEAEAAHARAVAQVQRAIAG
jgi:hypothetical protein